MKKRIDPTWVNPTRKGGMNMRKFSEEELLELYRQGFTNKEIADRLGVSEPAVYYRLERLQLANNCHKDQQVDLEQVKILHSTGLTTIGIALLLRANAATISQYLKELGLQDNYYRLKEIVV
jgi:predicted transcriptional regulator